MTKIRKHLSPGLVLGVIALAVALGGTSFAGPGKKGTGVKVRTAEAALTLPAHAEGSNFGVTEGTAGCPEGTKVVGGGVSVDNTTGFDAQELMESYPDGNRSWSVRIDNDELSARAGTVYALCLKVK